jgi:hypothetical protein
LVTLDGTSSSDVDGDPLTYSWTQIAGRPVLLDNPVAPTPTFTAPVADISITVAFQLIVSDGSLSSDPDIVAITVFNCDQLQPSLMPTSLVVSPKHTYGLSNAVLEGTTFGDIHNIADKKCPFDKEKEEKEKETASGDGSKPTGDIKKLQDNYLKQRGIDAERVKAEAVGDAGTQFNIYKDKIGWLFAVKITDSSIIVPLYWHITWPGP